MDFRFNLRKNLVFFSLAVSFSISTAPTLAETSDCELVISIPDTTSQPQTQVAVPILLDNFCDSIIGFSLWIQTDRSPDVLAFRNDSVLHVDTTYWKCNSFNGEDCIDSTAVPQDSVWDFLHVDSAYFVEGLIDTAGTLISGWEYVDSRSLSGIGTDMLITGIANLPGGAVTPGFPSQQGGTLLKIFAEVFEDTHPFTDSIVRLTINTDIKDFVNFVGSNPACSTWTSVIVEDTNCFVCTQWQIDSTQNPPDTIGCLNWQLTSLPPCDSIAVTVDTIFLLDTNKVCINNGRVYILPPFLCGDFNNDGVAGNILDLTFLVDRMFRGGPPGVYPAALDINCDNAINIIDLTTLVDFIFRGGPPPCSLPSCNLN